MRLTELNVLEPSGPVRPSPLRPGAAPLPLRQHLKLPTEAPSPIASNRVSQHVADLPSLIRAAAAVLISEALLDGATDLTATWQTIATRAAGLLEHSLSTNAPSWLAAYHNLDVTAQQRLVRTALAGLDVTPMAALLGRSPTDTRTWLQTVTGTFIERLAASWPAVQGAPLMIGPDEAHLLVRLGSLGASAGLLASAPIPAVAVMTAPRRSAAGGIRPARVVLFLASGLLVAAVMILVLLTNARV